MNEKLTNDNFLLYCAKHYDNSFMHSTEEFIEDLNKIKYIKKLITKYTENGDINTRLILNHIITMHNIFGSHLSKILYLKLKNQFTYIKPFLVLLNTLPYYIYNVGDEEKVCTDNISMDPGIIQELRLIINDKN